MPSDSERPFLWLPGWSATDGLWPGTLARRLDGVHVVCDFARCLHADDLLAAARAALLAAPKPVRIVGWSLGAMAALELARAHPERVDTLYLVAGSAQFVAKPGWSERVLTRMKARLESDSEAVLEDFDRRTFSEAERAVGADRRWAAARGAARWPLPALRAGLDFLCRFSVDPAAVHVPVFLLHGDDDCVCPLAQAHALAGALPAAQLTVWRGAGHAPFWSEPERFRAWLGERCSQT